MLLLELSDLVISDLDLGLIVHFVGVDHNFDVGARMFLYFIKPYRNTQEAFSVRQVKNHDYPVCTLVVCISDSSVSFLTRRVPNLKLDSALIDLQRSESEVDANGANVVFLKAVILQETFILLIDAH